MNKAIINILLKSIIEKNKHNKITLVGVDGKGCSGKSYLAEQLSIHIKHLGVNCEVVSIDDFCNKRAIRYCSEEILEPYLVYYKNFDEIKFENVLKMATRYEKFLYSGLHLDAKTDIFSKKISLSLNKGDVLIVEGLHLFKKKFVKYFDLKIIIDITNEEQLKRALTRDIYRGNDELTIRYKYNFRFIPSYNLYVKENNPFHIADHIIDNNNINNPILIK